MSGDDRGRSPAKHLAAGGGPHPSTISDSGRRADDAAHPGGALPPRDEEENGPGASASGESARAESKFALDLLLAIGVGGALGALSRYAAGLALPSSGPHAFPWSTLLVNVAGAVLIGFLAAVPLKRLPLTSRMRALIGIGYCGGLTTFSSMSVQISMQTSTAWGVGLDVAVGIAYTAVSITVGVLAVLIGWRIGQRAFSD